MAKKTIDSLEETAIKVSKSVRLTGIRLSGSLTHNAVQPGNPLPSFAGQKVEIAVSSSSPEGFVVKADIGISVGYEQDHQYSLEENVPVIVNAVFLLFYAVEGANLTKGDLDAFATRTATYNVWPYWREFVQSMTTRMGLPSMTIPLLHLAIFEDQEERSQKSKRKKKKG